MTQDEEFLARMAELAQEFERNVMEQERKQGAGMHVLTPEDQVPEDMKGVALLHSLAMRALSHALLTVHELLQQGKEIGQPEREALLAAARLLLVQSKGLAKAAGQGD